MNSDEEKNFPNRKIRKKPEPPSWCERYNCYSFTKGAIPVNISWERDGYQIEIAHRRLRGIRNLEDAKLLATMALARSAKYTLEVAQKEKETILSKNPDLIEQIKAKYEPLKWERL